MTKVITKISVWLTTECREVIEIFSKLINVIHLWLVRECKLICFWLMQVYATFVIIIIIAVLCLEIN